MEISSKYSDRFTWRLYYKDFKKIKYLAFQVKTINIKCKNNRPNNNYIGVEIWPNTI